MFLYIRGTSATPLEGSGLKFLREVAAIKALATAMTEEVVEVGPGVKKFGVAVKATETLNCGVSGPLNIHKTWKNGGGLVLFTVVRKNLIVKKPSEVSAAEDAGLPVAGLTALLAFTKSAGIKLDGNC
ncbi:hypothetical protein IFM89_030554 [Coptis chinensis]|uniref:Uncharacterized protein n=1 Tax=Coptis chinensis TaxID=261450 RepID=A0A835LX44_9MAGN|nr:hypothetical protein IFM89_030554 [Coptis chinensis]